MTVKQANTTMRSLGVKRSIAGTIVGRIAMELMEGMSPMKNECHVRNSLFDPR
jgi:hypothetical protein